MIASAHDFSFSFPFFSRFIRLFWFIFEVSSHWSVQLLLLFDIKMSLVAPVSTLPPLRPPPRPPSPPATAAAAHFLLSLTCHYYLQQSYIYYIYMCVSVCVCVCIIHTCMCLCLRLCVIDVTSDLYKSLTILSLNESSGTWNAPIKMCCSHHFPFSTLLNTSSQSARKDNFTSNIII